MCYDLVSMLEVYLYETYHKRASMLLINRCNRAIRDLPNCFKQASNQTTEAWQAHELVSSCLKLLINIASVATVHSTYQQQYFV